MIDTAAVLRTLAERGVVLPPGRVRVDGYGDSPALSRELLALIISGRKRAGTGLLWATLHDGEDLPQVGDIEVVIDHAGRPALVTRLTEVDIRPFDQVDARYAAIEGEGDGSLAFWRQAHQAFFARECARIGRTPAPDMPVVCSVFELLHVLPASPDDAPG
ncbi:ASCH domain-containing protein [Ideonella sp. 4Y16]|uniref:ASCH domain-containing protein n=1 Tax=Ideonella alba TaxID=2824118 RepID=A0A940YEN4_9BURK|nr:ASCH domain-containing protein [Ideonella alba]MBQ0931811.1 ASCH domain-containing protein [Ideonella alba]MBQ0941746.1 ASCH domain-containing protein [Ideonella alba]